MRRSPRVVVLSVALAALLHATIAGADDRDAKALDLFDRSAAAYQEGRFADALALLREAYALKKEPVLVYNMARAYEGMGDLRAAASAYEDFLRAQPDTPDRGAIETRIATLRRQLAEREELERRARNARGQTTSRHASPVPWIVAGIGAGAAVAGGVVYAMASQKHSDAVASRTYRDAAELQSRAESLATAADVCWIAGGVVLATGIVWGLFELSSSGASKGGESTPLTFRF